MAEWFEHAVDLPAGNAERQRAKRWLQERDLTSILLLAEDFPQIEESLHVLLDEKAVMAQVDIWLAGLADGGFYPTETPCWVDALGEEILFLTPQEAHALYVLLGKERFSRWADRGITVYDLHWVLSHCGLSPNYPREKLRDFPIFELLFLAEDHELLADAAELKHLGLMFVALCQDSYSPRVSMGDLRSWRRFVLDWWAVLRRLPTEQRVAFVSGEYISWASRGFKAEELLGWLFGGLTVYDVSTAESWKNCGFTSAEFKEWVEHDWPSTRALEAMELRRKYGRGYSVEEIITSTKLVGAFSGAFLEARKQEDY